MKYVIGVLILVVLAIGGFMLLPNAEDTPSLTLSSIESDLAQGAKLIDVRTPEEYATGHAPGSVNLPLDSIFAGTKPSDDTSTKVYVYCRSGNRSAQAAQKLRDLGFASITDIGGLTDWQSLGGSLIQ